jgi:hypothetical protein
MKINQFIIQILPPFMYAALDRVLRTRKYPLFNSYQDALAHCSQKGYENELLIDVLLYKMENYLNNQKVNQDKTLNPTQSYTLISITKLLAVYPNKNDYFHVLDFGGNLGGHYFDIKRVLSDKIKLKSGTLQCVDDPKTYLDKLLKLNAEFILFNRLGLNRNNMDVVTIHHSKLSWNGHFGLPPNVADRVIRYPFTFMSEKYFYDILTTKYQNELNFNDNTGILDIPSQKIIGGGLLFSRHT